MPRQQTTPTGRTWRSPLTSSPPAGGRARRRAALPAMPFGGARGRPGTKPARFGRSPARGRPPSRRRKQSSARSPLAFARGLFGSRGKGSKSSRKGPALLAVFGGLGAAGAAAFKRRQGKQDQSQPPVGSESPPTQAA